MTQPFDLSEFNYALRQRAMTLSKEYASALQRNLQRKRDRECQLAKLEMFTKAAEFILSLSALLAMSNPPSKTTSYLSALMTQVYKKAITSTSNGYVIDYRQVLVSKGNLPRGELAHTKASMDSILFSWVHNCKFYKARKNDKAILVAYCEALNKCIFTTGATKRCEEEAILEVPQFHGNNVQTWLSFISADGRSISNRVYSGAVTLPDFH